MVNGGWKPQGSLVGRLHPSQRDWCLVSSLNSSVSFFHLRISLPSFTPKGKTYLKPGHINSEGRLMELASSCQTWTDFWLMTDQSAEGWGGGRRSLRTSHGCEVCNPPISFFHFFYVFYELYTCMFHLFHALIYKK